MYVYIYIYIYMYSNVPLDAHGAMPKKQNCAGAAASLHKPVLGSHLPANPDGVIERNLGFQVEGC